MNKDIFSEEIKVFTPDVFTDYRGELWTTWKKDVWKRQHGDPRASGCPTSRPAASLMAL